MGRRLHDGKNHDDCGGFALPGAVPEKPVAKPNKIRIAELVKAVAESKLTDAKAGICAYDCLLSWEAGGQGMLDKVIAVWEQRLKDVAAGGPKGFTDTERHGVWVPSIPVT